jgi:hypothetical protein
VQLFNDDRDQKGRDGLRSADHIAFEAAIVHVTKAVRSGAPFTEAFAFVCNAVEGLGARERERRLQHFVERLALDPETLRELARFARSRAPWAVNAVLLLTPPAYRQLQPGASARESSAITPVRVPLATRTSMPELSEPFRAVALVGRSDEHDNNRTLLRSHSLEPLHVADIEALLQLAPTGLCGIVIGASLWHHTEPERHSVVLKRICEISTILFVRIATEGLAEEASAKLLQIHRQAAAGDLPASLFGYGTSSQLTAADLQVLHEVANLHQNVDNVGFFPAGLTSPESTLIRLLAGRQVAAQSQPELKTIAIRHLEGGRSKAKVFLIMPQGKANPFVTKLGERDALSRESASYEKWIRFWDGGSTAPAFHAHYGCHALSYRLESEVDAPDKPAETLHDRMEHIRTDDMWARNSHDSTLVEKDADDLAVALKRAIGALARLNARPANESGAEAWLHWPTMNFARRNISIHVTDTGRRRMLVMDVVRAAMLRVEVLQHKAIVHGDVHGRNVLIRDRTPVFIDFADSGPGHPCLDLARLDGTVRTSLFRAVDDEAECTRFCERLYCDGSSASELESEFPEIANPLGNLLWMRSAVQLREAAISVAKEHGGGLADFLAMTVVVSSYLLMHLVPGSGIERALLGGLSARILAESVPG